MDRLLSRWGAASCAHPARPVVFVRVAAGLIALMLLATGCSSQLRGDLEGAIIDSRTELAVPGVLVEARSMKNGRTVSDLTDETGAYYIGDATYGLNEVTITLEGYTTSSKYADIEEGHSVELDFRIVRILDTRPLTVLVDVMDLDGAPIAGARVVLYHRYPGEYGGSGYSDVLLVTGATDARGRVVFLAADWIPEMEFAYLRIDAAAAGFRTRSIEGLASYNMPTVSFELQLAPIR